MSNFIVACIVTNLWQANRLIIVKCCLYLSRFSTPDYVEKVYSNEGRKFEDNWQDRAIER